MFRRLTTLMLAGAAALAVMPAGAGASTSRSPDLTLTPTSVVHLRPVDKHGHALPGYTITKQRRHAECHAGSSVTRSAYRCFAGNAVLDPCWAQKPKQFAVCLSVPWSFNLVQLKVSKGYSGKVPNHAASLPWGVQLGNGVQCAFADGATGAVGGNRINYFCHRAKYVLIGKINKSGKVWHARKAKPTGGGHYAAAGRVGLTKAWFGKRSRQA
jgi:hypothetical protein